MNYKLGDTAIMSVVEHCKELQFLDMSGGIENEGEEVTMSFTDASICALEVGSPKLPALCVAHCPSIGKAVLEDLRLKHPKLKVSTTRERFETCLQLLHLDADAYVIGAADE